MAKFVPKSGVRIATTDAEAEALGSQSGESGRVKHIFSFVN